MFPRKINVEFVTVRSRDFTDMRVWERGAGPTLACGTGACATVVASVSERVDRPDSDGFAERRRFADRMERRRQSCLYDGTSSRSVSAVRYKEHA